MCFYPVIIMKINRSCWEISLHDPETLFNLPASFTYFQDSTYIIIKQIRTYRIKTIIPCFGFYHSFIQIMLDLCFLTIWSSCNRSDESCWVIWIFSLFFRVSGCKHFFGTFHLFQISLANAFETPVIIRFCDVVLLAPRLNYLDFLLLGLLSQRMLIIKRYALLVEASYNVTRTEISISLFM